MGANDVDILLIYIFPLYVNKLVLLIMYFLLPRPSHCLVNIKPSSNHEGSMIHFLLW